MSTSTVSWKITLLWRKETPNAAKSGAYAANIDYGLINSPFRWYVLSNRDKKVEGVVNCLGERGP